GLGRLGFRPEGLWFRFRLRGLRFRFGFPRSRPGPNAAKLLVAYLILEDEVERLCLRRQRLFHGAAIPNRLLRDRPDPAQCAVAISHSSPTRTLAAVPRRFMMCAVLLSSVWGHS